MYEYLAEARRIVDGDTLHVSIDLGLDIYRLDTIRLYGINCPEMSTPEGKAAKAYAEEWFARNAPDSRFVLQTIKDRREKYGRYLGMILAYNRYTTLNADLLTDGHAVPYYG